MSHFRSFGFDIDIEVIYVEVVTTKLPDLIIRNRQNKRIFLFDVKDGNCFEFNRNNNYNKYGSLARLTKCKVAIGVINIGCAG